MTQIAQPIRTQPAVLMMATTKATGMLVLYADRLAYVKSRTMQVCAGAGFGVIAVLGFALAHTGPGALGAIIGMSGGQVIGIAIARHQAPKKVAAGGSDVITVPLDVITGVDEHKVGRLKGWGMVVSTSEEAEYTFRVRPGQWPSAIANALTARGHGVTGTPAGLAVVSRSGS